MRITVDIDENKIDSILKWTHQNKKSPAIALALDEFLEYKRRQAFLSKVLSGKTDYAAGNDQIEKMSALEEP